MNEPILTQSNKLKKKYLNNENKENIVNYFNENLIDLGNNQNSAPIYNNKIYSVKLSGAKTLYFEDVTQKVNKRNLTINAETDQPDHGNIMTPKLNFFNSKFCKNINGVNETTFSEKSKSTWRKGEEFLEWKKIKLDESVVEFNNCLPTDHSVENNLFNYIESELKVIKEKNDSGNSFDTNYLLESKVDTRIMQINQQENFTIEATTPTKAYKKIGMRIVNKCNNICITKSLILNLLLIFALYYISRFTDFFTPSKQKYKLIYHESLKDIEKFEKYNSK
jgi:hypothetical protein